MWDGPSVAYGFLVLIMLVIGVGACQQACGC